MSAPATAPDAPEGHEVVAGVEAGEARKVGEARVRRQHQDQHGARLKEVVENVAGERRPVHALAYLREHGGRP